MFKSADHRYDNIRNLNSDLEYIGVNIHDKDLINLLEYFSSRSDRERINTKDFISCLEYYAGNVNNSGSNSDSDEYS